MVGEMNGTNYSATAIVSMGWTCHNNLIVQRKCDENMKKQSMALGTPCSHTSAYRNNASVHALNQTTPRRHVRGRFWFRSKRRRHRSHPTAPCTAGAQYRNLRICKAVNLNTRRPCDLYDLSFFSVTPTTLTELRQTFFRPSTPCTLHLFPFLLAPHLSPSHLPHKSPSTQDKAQKTPHHQSPPHTSRRYKPHCDNAQYARSLAPCTPAANRRTHSIHLPPCAKVCP